MMLQRLKGKRISFRRLRWPLLWVGLGAFLIAGRNFAPDYAQALTAPNGLYIPDARHNVPTETLSGFYSHTFRIYNARPRWVSVQATTDCGCVSVSWERTRIPPLGWRDTKVQVEVVSGRSVSSSILFQTTNFSSPVLKAFITSPVKQLDSTVIRRFD